MRFYTAVGLSPKKKKKKCSKQAQQKHLLLRCVVRSKFCCALHGQLARLAWASSGPGPIKKKKTKPKTKPKYIKVHF
jgi:hypothetical protein